MTEPSNEPSDQPGPATSPYAGSERDVEPGAGSVPEQAQAAGPAALPPVIRYVDAHTGPRRALWLHLTPPAMGRRIAPVVGIDGREFIVFWGTVGFEVPADVPVHVSVHVVAEALAQAASMLLLPEHKAEWTYHTLPGTGVAALS